MRLINTKTLTLQEFFGDEIPKYAILSHRWGQEEISLQEFESGRNPLKIGWSKVKRFCRFALSHNFEFVWMDTCCIDKTSSAELSEAINSMFTWYRHAEVCYASLQDVSSRNWSDPAGRDLGEFVKSRWFTRGWTLQELLAPRRLVFLDADWREIGSKADLTSEISGVTGIPKDIINSFVSKQLASGGVYHRISVATIMSWAARRSTTRPEDAAYSLLGLFGIYMPPIYGEGKHAFRRLQMEILRYTDDESIFLSSGGWGQILANTPFNFANCGDIRISNKTWDPDRPDYQMTNKGIKIELLLAPLQGSKLESMRSSDDYRLFNERFGSGFRLFLMPLNCENDDGSENSEYCSAILLLQKGKSNRYGRFGDDILRHPKKDRAGFKRKLVYIDA